MQAAARLGVPMAFEGFEAMIASADVDAVYVGSPPSMHREIVALACEHRKHVLCEKPVGVCAADAAVMTDSVSSANAVGMVNFEFRYRPARRLLGSLLRDGIIGAPRSIHIVNSSGFLDNPRRGWNWWSVGRAGAAWWRRLARTCSMRRFSGWGLYPPSRPACTLRLSRPDAGPANSAPSRPTTASP